jgi:adenylate cyclase
MERANQALLLNPDQATAHHTKALLMLLKAKPDDSASANEIIAEAEASLRSDPSLAGAYWAMAQGEMLLGRYEQGMSNLEQAMRISPRDSNIGLWHMDMGRDLLALRRYDAAIQEGLEAIDSGYRQTLGYAALAASYAAAA